MDALKSDMMTKNMFTIVRGMLHSNTTDFLVSMPSIKKQP